MNEFGRMFEQDDTQDEDEPFSPISSFRFIRGRQRLIPQFQQLHQERPTPSVPITISRDSVGGSLENPISLDEPINRPVINSRRRTNTNQQQSIQIDLENDEQVIEEELKYDSDGAIILD